MVIAEGTRKLLGSLFELQDLGTKELKGIAGAVRSYEAVRLSAAESRFEALRMARPTTKMTRRLSFEICTGAPHEPLRSDSLSTRTYLQLTAPA